MPAKNYYVVLGVSRDATPGGIRTAYRELAKRLHPDRAGQQGTPAFQDVAEAYQVLSDPGRRRRHDLELGAGEQRAAQVRRRVPVEPLSPDASSLFDQPGNVHPSFDEFYDRYVRNFTGRGVPKAERAEGLTVDIVLTPEEAAAGCRIPIGVPVLDACILCDGTGRDWLFPCLECHGTGLSEETRTLWVRVPPLVRSGAILEVPLDSFGVHNFYLRVHVSVAA